MAPNVQGRLPRCVQSRRSQLPRPCPLLQPTIKDVIGADKEKEYMDSLETMGG